MELSPGEKLILLSLAAAKDGEEEVDLRFIRSAILSGNTWALSWELSGIPSEDVSSHVADETADILTMWSFIEHSVGQLEEPARRKLEEEAYPFELSFTGFDGNHDPHCGVASFLIKEMDRFTEFSDRNLNSHTSSSLPHYRRMLPAYQEAMRAKGIGVRSLTSESILSIVKAGWRDPNASN